MVESSSYINTIKQNYYNAFLASLFIPKVIRENLWVYLNFCNELASISSKVNEELLAMIRFAWWHEQIKSDETPKHPVIIGIKKMVAEDDRLANHFIGIIDYYQGEYKEEESNSNPHDELMTELFKGQEVYLEKYNKIYNKLEKFDHIKLEQNKLPNKYKLRKVFIAIWQGLLSK